MGSKKKATVGYRYFLGVHMGVCHGPVDALLEIRAGDRTAWSGNVAASGAIAIDAPDLFGGEAREGGLQGTCDVMMGESAQAPNAYLTAQTGAPQPAFRGFLGLVYRGLIAANNPYLKPWAVRVRRIVAGWSGGAAWYPAKASIDLGDGVVAMNPAHIVYECLTNADWGMGYPTGQIDAATFTDAADYFFAEGIGLCLAWQRQDSIDAFVQSVVDHAGAIMTEDPATGLFQLKALRADYTVAALPEFSDLAGNVVELESFDRSTATETTNEITVVYTEAATGKEAGVTVQNLALIQAQGAVVNQRRQYPGAPTSAIALRLAMRDLRATTSDLARVRLVATRAAYGVGPGDVIRFSWSKLGVVDMALRVVKVNYGNLRDGRIRIDAVEDVFGIPATTYVAPPAIEWTPPNLTPQPATVYRVDEASYFDAVAAFGQVDVDALPDDAGFLIATAGRPAGVAIDFDLRTRLGADPYSSVAAGLFVPAGKTAGAVGPADTTVALVEAVDLANLIVGEAAFLGAEIVRVESVDVGLATVTIARGCADTTPQAHAAGTFFLGYGAALAEDPKQYIATEAVDAKIVTRTGAGTTAEAASPGGTVTMNSRLARPYPPARLRLGGQAYPAELAAPFSVTWNHRDRQLQSDQLIDTEAADIGPEAGTTYTVRVLNNTGYALAQQTGVSGKVATLSPAPYYGEATVEAWAVRDGLASFAARHTFTMLPQHPYVVGASDVVFSTVASQDVTIPAVSQEGDFLVAAVMHREALTPPAGWTLIESASFTNAGDGQSTSVYTKTAGALDPGASTTWAQAAADRMAVQIVAVRSTGAEVVVSAFGKNEISDTGDRYCEFPVVAADGPDRLALGVVSTHLQYAGNPNTFQPNTSAWTQLSPWYSNDTANQIRLGVAWQYIAGPTSTSGSFVSNGVLTNNSHGGVVLILKKVIVPVFLDMTVSSGLSQYQTITMPAAVNEGDLLVLLTALGSNRTYMSGHPAGFTEVGAAAAVGNLRFQVHYKVADGTEGGTTLPVTFIGSNAYSAIQVIRIKAGTFDPGNPIERATAATGSDAAPDYPELILAGGTIRALWISAAVFERSSPARDLTAYPFADGQERTTPAWASTYVPDLGTSWELIEAASQNPAPSTLSIAGNWLAETLAIKPPA